MTIDWPLVSYLADELNLNDCEMADLSSWATSLELCAEGKCGGEHDRLSGDDVKAHLGMRAEVLAWLGSPVQEMYDKLADYIGQDEIDYDDLMA